MTTLNLPDDRRSATARRVEQHTRRAAARPGPDVIPLHLGDPDFATPPFITEALNEALRQGFTHYAPPLGDPDLRSALAVDLDHRSAQHYGDDQVIVTAGAAPAINAAILATVDDGDQVVIPEPSYSLYGDSVRLAGGQPVFIPHDADLRLDLDRLEAAAAGARMLVLCQPCNPTGVVYTRDELDAVARIAADHDLLVLADEAYDHIVFDDVGFTSSLEVEELADRLLYCQTFSKTYAMTGWRIGYFAAPADLAAAVGLVHRTFNGPVNSAVQRAALAAVRSGDQWPADRCQDYRRRRDLVAASLSGVSGMTLVPPAGTFYAFPRYEHPIPSEALVRLALEHGIGLRAGREFGPSGESHLRLAFCVEDAALTEGLDRLKGLVQSLEC